MRANHFGDRWFADHVELPIDQYLYIILIVVDAASNLIWAVPQKSKRHDDTLAAIESTADDLMVKPKAICGDQYFHEEYSKALGLCASDLFSRFMKVL